MIAYTQNSLKGICQSDEPLSRAKISLALDTEGKTTMSMLKLMMNKGMIKPVGNKYVYVKKE